MPPSLLSLMERLFYLRFVFIRSKPPESLRDVIVLTNYGVDARYPGDFPNVTSSDAQQAIQMAEKVRRLVLELL